jgi:tripartite-type tricarboxylate transporter receptor subunit TctC
MHTTSLCRTLRNLAGLALLLWASLLALAASAQTYPTRPIRIITPYAPGSMVDATTRQVAEGLSRRLGQPVVVENRTGGLGMIAMTGLLTAPADGYTLLTDTPAAAINPTLNEARYDPKTDIAAIAQFMRMPFVVAVSPGLEVAHMQALVRLLKAPDSPVNVAVAGTSTGLVGKLFGLQAGATLHEVPYKGAAPAMLAVLKGEAQLIFLDAANLTPHINSGRLKGLMITSEQRSEALKDVPTSAEAGFAQFRPQTWFGLFARSDVPPEVQQRLNEAVREVIGAPDMQAFLHARGATAVTPDLAAFRRFFHTEIDTWADVIHKAGLK